MTEPKTVTSLIFECIHEKKVWREKPPKFECFVTCRRQRQYVKFQNNQRIVQSVSWYCQRYVHDLSLMFPRTSRSYLSHQEKTYRLYVTSLTSIFPHHSFCFLSTDIKSWKTAKHYFIEINFSFFQYRLIC